MGFSAFTRQLLFLISILLFTSKPGRALDNPHLGAAGVIANEYLPPAEDEGDGDHPYPKGGGSTGDEGYGDQPYPKGGGSTGSEDKGDGDHPYPYPKGEGSTGSEDKGDGDHPYPYPKGGGSTGYEGDGDHPYPKGGGSTGTYPDVIINKALECFNDKYIYKECEETYRLTQSGEVNVPPEYTDQFCKGPCLAETRLVLDCIDGIFKKFEFYNKATIHDIQETIDTGCSYGFKRGDFDVAEHIHTDEATTNKMSRPVFYVIVVMILMGWHVLY